MRRIAALALTLVLAAGAAGCHVTTGRAVCDARVGPLAKANVEGYHFDCTPPASWAPHLGWADHANHMLYVWVDYNGLDEPLLQPMLIYVMWHEVGHAVLYRLVGDALPQSTREWWADGFAWCAEPQLGVSYSNKPTNCAPYLNV